MDKLNLNLLRTQIEILDREIKNNPDSDCITAIRLARNILEKQKLSIVMKSDWFSHIPTPDNY